MEKRYLLIGGSVTSQTDCQTHHVSARRLCTLYRLDPRLCVMAEPGDVLPVGLDASSLIILRPRGDGDYRVKT